MNVEGGNPEYYKLSGVVDWADDIHVLGVRNTNPNLKILLDRLKHNNCSVKVSIKK